MVNLKFEEDLILEKSTDSWLVGADMAEIYTFYH